MTLFFKISINVALPGSVSWILYLFGGGTFVANLPPANWSIIDSCFDHRSGAMLEQVPSSLLTWQGIGSSDCLNLEAILDILGASEDLFGRTRKS